MIDPHTHCRDWEQRHKETIEHALSVAERIGLSGIFDMPNTDPPVDSYELVARRLFDAERIGSDVFYGLYVGLTSNPRQIKEAVRAWRDFFPVHEQKRVGVVGLKMFAGHSIGNLGIVEEDDQKLVYKTLAEEGYEGVLAVHCEKESLLKPELWNPSNPISHCYVRPQRAEVESVLDQIRFAEKADFLGHLHILHVSVPETVELIDAARKKGMRISCGVTPHHCVLNTDYMGLEKGILYKVNPPLRSPSDAERMLEYLMEGRVDWIETDHAPHTCGEKQGKDEKYMSGFPGLPFFPHFLELLRKKEVPGERIQDLTYNNIVRIFGLRLPYSKRPELNLTLHTEYEVDVYKPLRERWQGQ